MFKYKTPLTSLLQETSRGWKIIPASLELAKIDAMFGSDPKAATLLRQGLREDQRLPAHPS